MYKCPHCGTEYLKWMPECDWCPGVLPRRLPEIPTLTDDCPHRLELALKEIARLKPKADRWDAFILMCHRMGVQYKEVYDAIERKFSGR